MEENITRRERKKIHSKKSIVEAAVKLFSQKGYQETSVADIMNEADLGIGTFYNYFESKDEILKNLLQAIVEEIRESFESSLRQGEKPAAQVLADTVKLTASLLDRNRFVLPLFLRAADRSALPKEAVHTASAPPFKMIFDRIILAGQNNGEFRQDIPAPLITEMFHSVFQAASFSSLELSFMENVSYKLDLILAGIAKK
ncbi:MAG: TetR/AcrR family transcriptional regulator [Selenomonadaceae bacterium]